VRAWLRSTAGGLPATYWYLWTGILINRVGGFAVLFLSLYLTARRGASPAVAGLIVGTYGIGGVIGTLAGGVLTDRWGRRRTLLRSHLACVLTLAGLALAADLRTIAVLCALLGVTQSAPSPAFVAAIIDVVPAARRSRAFNLQFWAFNLGTAGASLLAGVLASWSYTGLFLIDAATTLGTVVVIAWKVPETLTRGAVHISSTARGLRTVLADRIFLAFVGLTLMQALIYSQTNTIVPLAMHADGLSPSAYGAVVALGGILIVAGQLFVPRLIDGHRKDRVLAASMLAMALGFASLSVASHEWAYLAAAVVWTVGSMLAAPPNAEINAELAPALLRGRYQAVFFLTFPAAAFLAPTLGGASLQAFGSAHWLIVAAVGLLAAALHLAVGPRRERRLALPSSAADPRPTDSGRPAGNGRAVDDSVHSRAVDSGQAAGDGRAAGNSRAVNSDQAVDNSRAVDNDRAVDDGGKLSDPAA
jgi:MFS family permease